MAEWSSSAFLQALGWATLNSFWQMALLWCCFWVANYFFKLSSSKKYNFSVAAISTGFVWFIGTFIYYYTSTAVETFALFNYKLNNSPNLLQILLTSASVTYLCLLIFPSYKLYSNWRFVQSLKKHGLKKADIQYRIFVQKIAAQLGIKKRVKLFISELVKSPVTIGYLKPIILLPVASLNNLTIQQTEAVLLHELSHIRRFDYLINVITSVVHTILYFNPFVKLFVLVVEEERENCCDQMVLQFDYDKVSYASALLTLEKTSLEKNVLAIGATGKKHLLNRIEKIVGMEKKPVFNFNHFAGLAAALLCILIINSVIITAKHKANGDLLSFENFENPIYYFDNKKNKEVQNDTKFVASVKKSRKVFEKAPAFFISPALSFEPVENNYSEYIVSENPAFIHVAYNEADAALNAEQKEQVKTTVAATKKVLSTTQWQEVEKSIAEVMTSEEKELAKKEYLQEVENINWKNLENKLKAEYEKLDWNKLNNYLGTALANAKLDSLKDSYTSLLKNIEAAEAHAKKSSCNVIAFPDESAENIQKTKMEIRKSLETIKQVRTRKVISL